jgi:hypothetical protein
MGSFTQIDVAYSDIGQYPLGRAFDEDRAIDKHRYVTGKAKDEIHVVFDEKYRNRRGKLGKSAVELDTLPFGNAGSRFIEKEDARLECEGKGDLKQALPAVRQRSRPLVSAVEETETVEKLGSLFNHIRLASKRGPPAAGSAPPLGNGQADTLEGRHIGEKLVNLESPGKPEANPPVLRLVGDIDAIEDYPASVGNYSTCE